jgi:hypothetical protein
VARSNDLSQAHKLTFDLTGAKVFPKTESPQQAGVTGPFSFTGMVVGSLKDDPAQPGDNYGTIPIGSLGVTPWIATASVTEIYTDDGTPHVGAANFFMRGVELDQRGQFVHVYFTLQWNWPLPFNIMMIIGYT